MWVQIAENALMSPSWGWVTTTFSPLKILPPPWGISDVLARVGPASPPAEPSAPLPPVPPEALSPPPLVPGSA